LPMINSAATPSRIHAVLTAAPKTCADDDGRREPSARDS
jgi:hypothetical protein